MTGFLARGLLKKCLIHFKGYSIQKVMGVGRKKIYFLNGIALTIEMYIFKLGLCQACQKVITGYKN